jgi:hypothetical protein
MATSGVVAFAPTLVDIFEEAFERATGDELRHGYQIRSMRRSLDLLMLDWQNRGYNLWMLENSVEYVVRGQRQSPMPDDCVDVIEVMQAPVPEQSELAQTAEAVDTEIVLKSALSNMSNFPMYIGEEQVLVVAGFGTVNLTVQRNIVSLKHPANTSVYIETTSGAQIAMTRVSVPDFANLPNKSTSGRPNTMLVRREAAPVTLQLWPVPDKVYAFATWYLRRMEDTGQGGTTPDVPTRFLPALIAGLAFLTGQKNPKSLPILPALEQAYNSAMTAAQSEDREKADLRTVPIRGYQRI